MFEFEQNAPVDTNALVALFTRAGWEETESDNKVKWVIAASEDWVTCTVEGELIGFARTYRVDPFRKVVFDLVVDERYQGLGLDAEIIRRLLGQSSAAEEVAIFRLGDPAGDQAITDAASFRAPEAPPGAYLG